MKPEFLSLTVGHNKSKSFSALLCRYTCNLSESVIARYFSVNRIETPSCMTAESNKWHFRSGKLLVMGQSGVRMFKLLIRSALASQIETDRTGIMHLGNVLSDAMWKH